MKYEHVIRRAAGLGKAPKAPDPDRYGKTYAHCDVLVVGAGPAGLVAALAAGAAGARGDPGRRAGGARRLAAIVRRAVDGKPASEWLAETVAALARCRR